MSVNGKYTCAVCGSPAFNSHDRESTERMVGPNQETIKPFVRGLGTWRCTKCRTKVKVKRGKV